MTAFIQLNSTAKTVFLDKTFATIKALFLFITFDWRQS